MFKLKSCLSINLVGGLGFSSEDGKYHYELRKDFEDVIKEMASAGYDCIELDISGTYDSTPIIPILEEGIEIVKKYGIKPNSVHMPMCVGWVDLASPWERDRKEIAKYYNKLLKYLDKYDFNAYVFHPGGDYCNKQEDVAKFTDYLVESVNTITEGVKGKVCIENMIYTHIILDTYDKVANLLKRCPKAYTCVDVNHFYYEKAEDVMEKYGNRIGAVHISDYEFGPEQHKLPKDGKINYNKIINALEKAGFDGGFTYEVSYKKYGYTIKDCLENHKQLFEEYNKNENN